MRFSIRDLLWATALVAMGLGWWTTSVKRLEAVGQAHRLRDVLVIAKECHYRVHDGTEVSFAVLDEQLVEP